MKSQKNPTPSVLLGHYPEKAIHQYSLASKLYKSLKTPFTVFCNVGAKQYDSFMEKVAEYESQFNTLSEVKLSERLVVLRKMLSLHGLTDPLMAEVFAIIKLTSGRELGIKPYDTQLIAARIMLDGKLAEMATGEGKTLATCIGAATAALAGIPVHIITSNDYLVTRDSASLAPLYQALGLSVGALTQGLDVEARKLAYARDVTYVTAKELVFDYLRDHTIGGVPSTPLHTRVAQLSGQRSSTLLRGLCMAVIDEADSILIDEACVPLILSRSVLQKDQLEYHQKAINLALALVQGQDFTLDHRNLTSELTEQGRQKLIASIHGLSKVWQNRLRREEIVCQALAAQYLYQRDRHYLVRDDSIHIIDEVTGRIATGRMWSRGLHQLIEIKEGCQPSGEFVTAAQITYQRFFPRYLKLGGMSGTLSESRLELYSVYGLKIVKVQLRKSSKRITLPTIIYRDKQALWNAIVERVEKIHQTGRPILIGTDSVMDSESLSQKLHAAGLPHEVLNARQDQREANIIAKAGQLKQITVSTNIAGRGTDIALGSGVHQLGGLHLICCQHNASRRIDRQLLGRCARHGDPGSSETLISIDKPLICNLFPKWLAGLAGNTGLSRPPWLVTLILRLPQWLEESRQYALRQEMIKQDALRENDSSIPYWR